MTHDGLASVLDLRALDRETSGKAFVAAVSALTPGETLHVLAAVEPVGLLERLEREEKGCADGWTCSHDPMGWHIDVSRGHPSSPGCVADLLEEEHRRLARLCEQAFEAHALGRRAEAREAFGAFRRGLLRHIRVEEELLFPVFEIRAGLPTEGPTATMRAEHRDIRLLLEELALALYQDRATAGVLRRSLDNLLSAHNRKEEAVLYPVLDRLLTLGEGATLAARFEALQTLNEGRT